MRIGLISDLHWMQEPPSSAAAWHGGGEFAGVLDRLNAALEHFAEADVDLVVASGDLAHHGDLDSLVAVLEVLADASAPVAVVVGNHDVSESPDRLAEALSLSGAPGVSLVAPEAIELAGLRLAGVHVGDTNAWFAARLATLPAVEAWGAGPLVLVSHYPVLSLAMEVAARGLPYPGDLLDREPLAEALMNRQAPTVVLGGHAHARATRTAGPILQLSAGAMVEPPYECAVIDLFTGEDGELGARRRCLRLLGEPKEGEPVLAPEQEEWRFAGHGWTATRSSERAEGVSG